MLVLRELAIAMPTYFYQQVSQFFELIFHAVQDPKPAIREAAVEALRAALVVTAQRESARQTQRPQWYTQCYEETVNLLRVEAGDKRRDERIHGALLVINELMRCSNSEWEHTYELLLEKTDTKQSGDDYLAVFNKPRFVHTFNKRVPQYQNIISNSFQIPVIESALCRQLVQEKYNYVCLDVLNQRNLRNPYVQQTLMVILPRLAAFNRKSFVENHLPIAMNYLLGTLKSREKDRALAFITIGLIAVAVEEDVESYMDRVMEVIKLALPKGTDTAKKRITIDSSIFKCITFLGHALNDYRKLEIQVILEPILATGLTPALTICLRELAAKVPEYKTTISSGLLHMLSHILMNKPLRHPGMPHYIPSNVLPFAGGGDAYDTQIIVLALHTLGTFDFDGQSLLQFVRRCADYFIVHENRDIRLEAVKTCSRLLKQALYTPVVHPSETVTETVANVLHKLLMVGMTDTDPDVRFWVLVSLDTTFDNHLAQAESLGALFVALHDEVFEIREAALCTIGRLSTMNPAYVMPSLRKTLVQLLTELEHSGTGRNKEQGAKMLDHLVMNAPRLIRHYMEPILNVSVEKGGYGQKTELVGFGQYNHSLLGFYFFLPVKRMKIHAGSPTTAYRVFILLDRQRWPITLHL